MLTCIIAGAVGWAMMFLPEDSEGIKALGGVVFIFALAALLGGWAAGL